MDAREKVENAIALLSALKRETGLDIRLSVQSEYLLYNGENDFEVRQSIEKYFPHPRRAPLKLNPESETFKFVKQFIADLETCNDISSPSLFNEIDNRFHDTNNRLAVSLSILLENIRDESKRNEPFIEINEPGAMGLVNNPNYLEKKGE